MKLSTILGHFTRQSPVPAEPAHGFTPNQGTLPDVSGLADFFQQLAHAEIERVVPVELFQDDGGPCLFVGCGRWPAPDTLVESHRLLLNNKGTMARFGSTYTSVT